MYAIYIHIYIYVYYVYIFQRALNHVGQHVQNVQLSVKLPNHNTMDKCEHLLPLPPLAESNHTTISIS